MNTLALRIHPDENKSFIDLVKSVKKTCIEVYANQDAPWNEVVKRLNPKRSMSYTPVFQVMLVFQNSTSHNFHLDGLEIEKIRSGTSTSKYDLYLTFVETEYGLQGWLAYNSDIFKRGTVQRLINELKNLAGQVIKDPDIPLKNLPLLPIENFKLGSTREVINSCKNARDSISEIFTSQLYKTPNDIALSYRDEDITYQELDRYSNIIANQLRASGARPGDRIALHLKRSPAMIASMLAVFKSACSYIPIDPFLPDTRKTAILEHSNPKVILTRKDLDPLRFETHVTKILVPDRGELVISENFDGSAYSSQFPAYIMYTSGSTGAPKGVMGTHRGLFNRLQWMWEQLPFEKEGIYCHKTTCSFVDSVAEIWGPILKGYKLTIYPQEEVFDLFDFIRYLAEKKITRIVMVPSLLRSILEYYPNLSSELPCLKTVIVSGEELQSDLVELFYSSTDGVKLINFYGSTEVAGDVTFFMVAENSVRSMRTPIGKAISNSEVFILDRYLRKCPVGMEGDLYVGGDALAFGYYGDPSLTAETFIPSPFHEYGAQLYRTGDRARYLPDGNVEYLGRVDRQIKLRGFRIDLNEVEALLRSLDGILEAVCEAFSDDDDNISIHAWCRIDEDFPISIDQMLEACKRDLPEYMVPRSIRLIDKIPLTHNGKVDKHTLRSLGVKTTTHGRDEKSFSLCSPTQIKLADLWERILNTAEVHAASNFFDLGGHSLVATKMISEIRNIFNVEIKVGDIFNLLTIETIASHIDKLVCLRMMLKNSEDNHASEVETFEF